MKTLPVVSHGYLAREFMMVERAVRSHFLKGREREIEGGLFEWTSIRIQTFLPSSFEMSHYAPYTDGPTAALHFIACYRTKTRNGTWKNVEAIIGSSLIVGVPFQEEKQYEAFCLGASERLTALSVEMMKNWREGWPMLEDYFGTDSEKRTLYSFFTPEGQKQVWAKNCHELCETFSICDGFVRVLDVELPAPVTASRFATKEEMHLFFIKAKMSEAKDIKIELQKEKEKEGRKNDISKLVS